MKMIELLRALADPTSDLEYRNSEGSERGEFERGYGCGQTRLANYVIEEAEALQARVEELEALSREYFNAVTHFNKTHGDLDPLLKAYARTQEVLKND